MKFVFTFLAIVITLFSQAQYFQKQEVFTGDFLEPYDFNIFDNHLFYTGVDENSTFANRLYFTNGSIGNIAVQEDGEGNRFDIYEVLGEHLGALYFYGNTLENPYELYKITYAGDTPLQITNFNNPDLFGTLSLRSMREIDNNILFDYDEVIGENRGKELWITDGTPEGTEFFLDINPNGDGFGYWVGELDNILYFCADNGVDGLELWRTDGTIAGTHMVKDINPSGDGFIGAGVVYDNRLFFVARNNEQGQEVWTTDGTEAGTQIFTDLNAGSGDGLGYNPQFTVLNGRLYFLANDGQSGSELWSTEGTVEGTELVADISAGSASSLILNITPFEGRLYFAYRQQGTSDQRHLWLSDGTEAGTLQVNPSAYIDLPRDMFQVDNELVFLMNNSEGNRELWRTDGTDEGTYEIFPEGLENQWQILGDGHFELFGGRLFVDAALNGDADLWSYGAGSISSISDYINAPSNLLIFPNPSADVVFFDISFPQSETVNIQIFDALGREVFCQNKVCQNQFSISKESIGTGFFTARITCSNTHEIINQGRFVMQ
ncbi:MAG: T9SS type A sorting domain-containing protein [Bacteroidia bacterium]